MNKTTHDTYPIDIVIPWVDGTDPSWLEQKARYSNEITKSVHAYNYQEWGLLRYWFRGIQQNAPWVRNVYFITWGHIPPWLNTEHPKLCIVNHRDYIPEQYLPTFSSHTIELNIHRIKGLSEHFIYFNDDIYLVQKTRPEDFFVDGLPCDSAVVNPIAPSDRYSINSLQFTTAAVINEHFSKKKVMRRDWKKWFSLKYRSLLLLNLMFLPWGRFPGLLEKHIPSSFLKSTFDEVWKEEYELLDSTCSHRFRDFKSDINQWILKEWQICSGKFIPRDINCGKLLTVANADDAKKAAELLKHPRCQMVCINDHLDGVDPEVQETIIRAFDAVFPNKSEFER